MTGVLQRAGHEVPGLDTYLYESCDFGVATCRRCLRFARTFGTSLPPTCEGSTRSFTSQRCRTTRWVSRRIDHVRHQSPGKRIAGTGGQGRRRSRFLFASSCSLYGAAGDAMLDESAAFNPITAYGQSKVLVERDVATLADDSFSPTFLRNATAYGVSPRLRADIVVNNLVGVAYTTGEVLIQSDGTPWRPLVHIEDISRAFLAVLEAPREAVHNQAFNVGSSHENYQIREIADMVKDVVPGCVGEVHGRAADPIRAAIVSTATSCRSTFPVSATQWTVRRGVEAALRELQAERPDEGDVCGIRPAETDPGAACGRRISTPRFAGDVAV